MESVSNVPKLRFPEFDDEWQSKLLKDVVHFSNGKAHENNISESGNYVVVNSKFISTEGTVRKYSKEEISPLSKSDIVMVMSDVPNGKALAKCYFIEEDNKFTLNQRICSLSKKNHENKFLFYQVNRHHYFLKFDNGVGQTNLRKDEVLNCPVSIPVIEEQQKIASFLTEVDNKIEQLTKKKQLLSDYKKGVMQQIFSQQIRFKQGDGNDFPDWEVKKLEELGKWHGGGTPETAKAEFWDGDIHWFTPTELKTKYVVESKRTISKEGLNNSSTKLLSKGSILLSTRATVGEVSITLSECTTNQGFQSLVVSSNYSNEFIYYLLKATKKQILRRASGSTFLEISKSELSKIRVSIPVFGEQKKISGFLTHIDNKINQVDRQLAGSQQFKQGLLQQMFV